MKFLLAGLLALALGPAHAAAPTGATTLTADEQQAVQSAAGYLDRLFELPEDSDAFDPELRPEVEALLRDMRTAIDAQARRWVVEPDPKPMLGAHRSMALLARLVAAMTLWRTTPLDAADDARWSRAASQHGVCVSNDLKMGATAFLYLQAVPPAERAAALAAERQRLQRFGQLPATPTHAPQVDVNGDLRRAVQALRALGADQEPALIPALSDLWLGDTWLQPTYWVERCAATQWWMALPSNKASADEKLAVLRYELAPLAQDFAPGDERDQRLGTVNLLPSSAGSYGVSGALKLRLQVDAAGKVIDARVVSRKIEVPGLGPLPPTAFETVYDETALLRARAEKVPPPIPDSLRDGLMTVQREYRFSIHTQ